MRITRWSNRYQSRRDPQNELRVRLRDLAGTRIRYGYRRLTVMLRREGWRVNTKRELPKLCYKKPHFDVRNDSGAEACTLPFTGDFDEDACHGFLRPRRGNAFLVSSSETIEHPIRRGAGLRVGFAFRSWSDFCLKASNNFCQQSNGHGWRVWRYQGEIDSKRQ
jgi:transposase InsO family protein